MTTTSKTFPIPVAIGRFAILLSLLVVLAALMERAMHH